MIIMIATGSASSVRSVEFTNQRQCETAKQQVSAKFAKSGYAVDVRCVEK